MESISIDQLKGKLLGSNPMNVIDVRTDEETALGIIPGAKTIPMNEIPDNLNQFNKNETYYIICAAGVRSAKVVNYLEGQEINAVNVDGGMNAWGSEGTEIESI
ncbi:rhodanese-like domain-containing protein [Staphylococcus devriesei]|uniref:rhodanese-like domain-containing protein n=1 Tax=Staphylococcus devriesei TaxID=586733 RepID=UPI000E6857D7|nr:rhodanese-like domain-containing protein [Staphylococcus devriesei]RIL71359.1 rhodanese-like domain-containing protein [Staphylococcus devriesei]